MNTSIYVLFISASCVLLSLSQGVAAANETTCANYTTNATCCGAKELTCSFYACYNKTVPSPDFKCIAMNATLETSCTDQNLTYVDKCAVQPGPTTANSTVITMTTQTSQPTTQTAKPTTKTAQPTTQNSSSTPQNPSETTTMPKTTTTKGMTTTTAPTAKFDAGSFVGGLVLGCGLFLIGIFAYKFYKSRSSKNYHTL